MIRSIADRVGQARLNSGVRAWARASRSSCSCGWMAMDRPFLAAVHLSRSGQPAQAAPKVTVRAGLIGRVTPAGQVTVPASSLTVKSSRVNPPGTAGYSGLGLMMVSCPASR